MDEIHINRHTRIFETTEAATAKRNFVRRTKSTANPDTQTDIEVSTSKYPRRNTFKTRKDPSTTETPEEQNGGKKEAVKRPSLVGGGARSERPTRNFVRRRPSGANATTTSTTPSSSSPSSSSPSSSSPVSSSPGSSSPSNRRPFRVAARRRTLSTSTTTSTTEIPTTEIPTTLMTEDGEESLQDIGDTDVIEDPSLLERPSLNRTKTQRRPLLLKEETVDQNPSATNEEERKRHSKKYSASFKQNQLEEVLKQRAKLNSQEDVDVTTEGVKTTVDDFDPETALAIAAHQLLSAPLPSIPNYDEDDKPAKKSSKTPTTTYEYKFTSPTYTEDYTDTKTINDFSSTPIYKTTIGNQDFVQTTIGTFDVTTDFNSAKTPTTYLPKTSTYPSRAFTSRVSRPSGFTTANILSISEDPTSEFSRVPATVNTYSRSQSPTVNPAFSKISPSTSSRGFSKFSNPSTLTSGFPTVPSSLNPSTARYVTTSEKLIPVPVEDISITTGAYSSIGQEPSYFTREYLLESPVTKTYDEEYQYLSPTTPQSTTRKIPKKIAYRKISTTIRPTIQSYVPVVTPTPRRVPNKKPFEKIPLEKTRPNKYKPVENYDYYDEGVENVAQKYAEGTKVVLHSKGTIECLDIGNFPHPTSCKKFISCAKLENGSFLGWEYICPKGLSFDPIGGICNWSAGLGCSEKDI